MSCSNKGDTPALTLHAPAPREIDWPWPSWFRDLTPSFTRMWQKRRQRQRLLELDQHLLSDIGITRDQAEKEAAKWMWDWTV
jgi:uncharacterized protein YjiS (DUF1127 family)